MSPPLGRLRPAIRRSSVDLPEPERPSSPTISPSRSDRLTSSRTLRAPPPGLRKDCRTARTSSKFVDSTSAMAAISSIKGQSALGEQIERSPQQPVAQDHEDGHHGDAEHDAAIVAGLRRPGDVGADAVGAEFAVAPADILGDHAGVPGAAGRGDRAGEIVGKYA